MRYEVEASLTNRYVFVVDAEDAAEAQRIALATFGERKPASSDWTLTVEKGVDGITTYGSGT